MIQRGTTKSITRFLRESGRGNILFQSIVVLDMMRIGPNYFDGLARGESVTPIKPPAA